MTDEIADGQRNSLMDIANDRTRSARMDAVLARHLHIREIVICRRCAFLSDDAYIVGAWNNPARATREFWSPARSLAQGTRMENPPMTGLKMTGLKMTNLKMLAAAALISTISISTVAPVSAAEGGPEVYWSQHPDRDAYTGELTPAARLGLEGPYGAAPNPDVIRAYRSMGNADAAFSAQPLHGGRHHREHLPRR
jgi:hypothetical protein